jgi:tetratricopeptide (TPR) repeat protein
MDPLRSDMRPAEALSGAERDARIEQLLLAGLDEYFAHRYEHAINLWTRVLFFDRQHDRARAYIERARRAQAELQRESEAALHQAIDAFRAGDVGRARELVTQALDSAAPPDEAQGMLERIERLGVAQKSPRAKRRIALPPVTWSANAVTAGQGMPGGVRAWPGAVLLAAAAIGVLAVAAWGLAVPESAWSIFSSPAASSNAIPWTPEPLPIPQASETYLSRARALAARGRVHDALSLLDRVPIGDPLRSDADQLRAEVQLQLLSLVSPERPRE